MNTVQDTVDPFGLIVIALMPFILIGAWWLFSKLTGKGKDR